MVPALKGLSVIMYLFVKQWSYINELNKLQNLKDLKIQFNPLLEDKTKTHGTIRTLFIAKILSLEICNRTVVSMKNLYFIIFICLCL